MPTPLVSIIIPAINEEARLPKTLNLAIEFLKKQNYDSEILVVTDGSTDKTVEIAQSFISQFPQLRIITFPLNRGKGFAIKAGMFEAKGQFKLFMDADSAVPIDFLNSFLKKCQDGWAVVIGSRTHPDSKILKKQRFLRRHLAVVFRYLQKAVLRLPYWDTQCGFKLFTAQAAEQLFAKTTFDCSLFDAELLYLAHSLNVKVFEHPVIWTHDDQTRLPIGPRRSVELLIKLFAIKRIHAKHG